MTLGDRIAVLRDGAAEQIAPPLEVYRRPVNVFVATFVDHPKMNLLDVRVTVKDGGRLALDGPGFSIDAPLGTEQGVPLLLWCIRPRDVVMVAAGQGDATARITWSNRSDMRPSSTHASTLAGQR